MEVNIAFGSRIEHLRSSAMTELTFLAQLALTVALVAAPIVVFVRFLGDGSVGGDVLAAQWPKGVQEEDPKPWRVAAAG